MPKKRKASSQGANRRANGRIPGQSSKLSINTYEDVADSEDEFFINRDKVLLEEGSAQKRRRKLEEDEALLEPSDEEVLPEPSQISASSDEESQIDGAFLPELIPIKATGQNVEYASDSSDFPAGEDEDAAYDWGTLRNDYYNADPIVTEADALEEEAEARRLQKKQLQKMTEADFGLDEIDWAAAKKEWTTDGEDGGKGRVISEVLPKVEITDSMSPEEKMKILRLRYPEFEPLAKEYVDLQVAYHDLSLDREATLVVDSTLPPKSQGGSTVAAVKLNALGGYLAALCMYFALLSATDMNLDEPSKPMPPVELHDHGIMDTLVKCRQLWERVKDMEIPEPRPLETAPTNGLHSLQNGDKSAINNEETPDLAPKPRKRKSNSEKKAARALASAQAESEARRLERLRKTEESLKDLSSLTNLTSHLKPNPPKTTTNKAIPNDNDNDNDSDLGDPTTLTPHEAAQKAANKKSLRFYTSQIAQKSNRRDAAGRDAGGDADIPYKERIRDRQARLNAEAEARGRKKDSSAGVALDEEVGGGSDSGSEAGGEQRDLASEVRNDEDEDYYDLVAARSRDTKTLKAAHAQAAREGGVVRILDPEDEVGKDGKRGITYAIEKNKGLAPKRRKDVRNPRVKRRMKYEDKKKKLGSVKL
ncbi:MAG: hypothetical protein Q9170_006524 [Blastenia crenularia]